MSAIYDSSGNLMLKSTGSTIQIGDPSEGLTVQVTKIEMDGSDLLAEASLGSQFSWDAGLLTVDASVATGTSYEYVDGSLAIRDALISQNASDISDVSTRIPTDFYSQAYVDGSLNAKANLSKGIQVIADGQYPSYVSSLDDLVSYITSLVGTAEGVVITMPPGDFSTDSSIVFPSGIKITWKGAGSGYSLTFNAGATFNDWSDISRVKFLGGSNTFEFNQAIFLKDSLVTGNINHTVSDFNVTKCGINGDYTNSGSGKIVALNLELNGKASLTGTGDQMLMNTQIKTTDASVALYSAGQLIASNLVVQNLGTGDDINCDNGAGPTAPNLLDGIFCFTGGITCGTAVSVVGSISVATSLNGSAISRLNTA